MTYSNPDKAELLRKYNIETPCYSAYPTLSEYHSKFGDNQYVEHVQQTNMRMLPNDLALTVHVPYKETNYLNALDREIALQARLFNNDRLVKLIYFDSGASSMLKLDQTTHILDQIASQFHLDIPGNVQMCAQLDSTFCSPDNVYALGQLGFNRFSVNLQNHAQPANIAGRLQDNEEHALALIRAAASVSKIVNVSLIRGLAKQTQQSLEETLRNVITTGVTRITIKDVADLPKALQQQIMLEEDSIADAEARIALTELSHTVLLNAGYIHIGLEQFALPSDPLSGALKGNCLQLNRHGYTTFNHIDIVGIGAGAFSRFDTACAQNEPILSHYVESISDHNIPISKGLVLTGDDRLRAQVIKQIMCRHSVDLSQSISAYVDRESNITMLEYFNTEIKNLSQFINDGLIQPTRNGFDITDNGRYFTRFIAMTFDRYLNPQSTSENVIPMPRAV